MGRLSHFTTRRARRLATAALATLTIAVLAGCTAQVAPGSPTKPSTPPTTLPAGPSGTVMHLGNNISDYVKLHGDQVVVVPNGTYHASGTVTAPHTANTSGPLKGWLVLKAQSVGGVVVDLSKAPLTLDASTSHVLFVGFSFVNGSVYAYGSDTAFWYTTHTFPAQVWSKQAPNPAYPENGLYRAPRTVYTNNPTSHRVAFYGTDAHDTGTAFMISGSRNMKLEGVEVWNLTDGGLDPHDVVHPDALGGVAGNVDGLQVLNSWIKGRIMIQDGPGHGGSSGGAFQNFLFAHTWVSNSPSAGFTFTASKTTSPRGIYGKFVDVHSWANKNGYGRIDIVDGKQYYTPNCVPSRVNVAQTSTAMAAPTMTASAMVDANPAALWRAAHPYNSWIYALNN